MKILQLKEDRYCFLYLCMLVCMNVKDYFRLKNTMFFNQKNIQLTKNNWYASTYSFLVVKQ